MRNVVVTGSGRSGTSCLAGTLAKAGYFQGGVPYAPRDANPKGFFETHEVNGVNEALLAGVLPSHPRLSAGQRWLATLAPGTEIPLAPDLATWMERLAARAPWCFKDPRFCHTLPAWRAHLGEPVFLAVFRDPAVTAASIVRECASAGYLAGVGMTFERALAIWTSSYQSLVEVHAREGEWHFVHCDQLLSAEGLDRLAAWTGASVARDFPERALQRTRSHEPVTAEAAALYEELCARAGFQPEGRPVQVAAAARPPARCDRPELSVILCTYDRRRILERSLASFEAQDAPAGSFEIVVVNDGSRDGTRELLERWKPRVPATVVHRENGGLSAARNSGIERARGDLLLFVNDDTIARPDLVARHLARHRALAPEQVAVLGTFEQPPAALDNALMRSLETSDLVFRYADLAPLERYAFDRFWTCNVSAARDAVIAAGGFDESFRHYGCEDLDLGLRLGLPVVFDATARAEHDHVLDFDALKRRQHLVARAFVRLLAKHPSALDFPDWGWVRGLSLAAIDAEVARNLARLPELESAVRELARIDVGRIERGAAPSPALANRIVRNLTGALRDLNLAWWQAGFAEGLREHGARSFASLCGLDGRAACPPGARAGRDRLEEVRELAGAGELELATVEAIRLGASLANDAASSALAADVLNDLAVLRHGRGDTGGARAILRAAAALAPESELVRANRADVERSTPERPVRWADGPDAAAAPTSLNPWTAEVLALAKKRAGLAGAEVLEVGGAVPEEHALATGAKRWTAFYLGAEERRGERYELRAADARKLPWPDASFDVAFSSCAFEHIEDLGVALAEIRRVLRPGGAIATHFAPIWSCAVGHHLWETDGAGERIMFLDPVIPLWGHLLLEPRELRWFLELVLGEDAAERAVSYVFHNRCINRVFEGDFHRLFDRAGFDASGIERLPVWKPEHEPTARLRAELERAHPTGGDFATPGFRGVLVKDPAAALPAPRAASTRGAAARASTAR